MKKYSWQEAILFRLLITPDSFLIESSSPDTDDAVIRELKTNKKGAGELY